MRDSDEPDAVALRQREVTARFCTTVSELQDGSLAEVAHCRFVGRVALSLATGDDAVAAEVPVPLQRRALALLEPLGLGAADVAAIGDGYSAALMGEGKSRQNARKQSGSYYTPGPLVAGILERALEPVLLGCRDESALFALRILDPACGSGHFLVAAHARLAKRLGELRGERGPIAEPRLLACLEGCERDPFVALVCEARLRQIGGDGHDDAMPRVHLGDALLDEAVPHGANGTYDVVLGNPPWISYSGRHAVREDPAVLARLEARYPPIRAWRATHSAFVLRSLELVRPGGHVGLVLPLQLRYHTSYRAVRDAAAGRCRAVTVVDAGEQAFADVAQATGLFHLVRAESANATLPTAAEWPLAKSAPHAAKRDPLEAAVAALREMPRFPEALFGDPGVHSGNVSTKLIRKPDDPDVLAAPAQFAPIREGRDIQPYRCGAAGKRLWLEPTLAEGEYCRVLSLARYAAVPILIRQTAARPIAARHTEPSYFRNSLLACTGLDGVDVDVLLAILNSALIGHYHQATAGDAKQRTFPQVKVSHLRSLPAFPPARLTAQRRKQIIELVRQREHTEDPQVEEVIDAWVIALYGLPPSCLDEVRSRHC